MTFAAKGLPAGLQIDAQTERPLKIVCGEIIGLTPAMGWNSWNCFASSVSADKIKAAADAMVSSGLVNHGFTYINIDDFWQVKRDTEDPTLLGPQRDAEGRILPNPRFPDMKELTDYIHSKGLKAGIYSSPGPWTCGGCAGSWQHEQADARQYGDWAFDYLKYDWCSYGGVEGNNHSLAALKKPYQVMRTALDAVHRDILFSLCQYGWGEVWRWQAEVGGNSARTTGDITDNWGSMSAIGFRQAGEEKYAGPGHFSDPDMLIVGKVGWGPKLHPTRRVVVSIKPY